MRGMVHRCVFVEKNITSILGGSIVLLSARSCADGASLVRLVATHIVLTLFPIMHGNIGV